MSILNISENKSFFSRDITHSLQLEGRKVTWKQKKGEPEEKRPCLNATIANNVA
jgi:hypothetical protein